MRASTSLRCELNKTFRTKELLELKNYISKFHKGKETFNALLTSQKFHCNTHCIGYEHRASSLSFSQNKFIKANYNSNDSAKT